MKKETIGEISLLLSTIFFAIVAILVKLASSQFSGFFISFFRFVVGITLGVILLFITKQGFKIYDKKLWILRGVYGSVAMVLYYVAIQMTSSGRATLLNVTYPIFVALFGFFFFKEKINIRQVISITICIFGIVLVYYDGSRYGFLGNTLGLLSSVFSGMAIHYIRKSSQKNDPIMVYLSACFFGLLICSFSAGQAVNLNAKSLFILISAGILVFIGQYLMTYGYQYVSSTKGSITSFFIIPLTLVFSYFFVGEVMNTKFLIGTALVVIGLFINRE